MRGSGSLTGQLAWRFLRGPRSRLLGGTARAALAAIALGVAAMVIGMALMTGYREDLQRKLIGDNAAVGAYPLTPSEAPVSAEQMAAIEAIPGVERMGLVAYGQGLLGAEGSAEEEVTLRGVDPDDPGRLAAPGQLGGAADGGVEDGGRPRVVLGSELARRLGVAEGDAVRLTALGFGARRPRFRFQTLEVAGIFTSGLAEFDGSWAVVARDLVERLNGRGASAVLYELNLDDPTKASRVAEEAEAILGPGYLVTDWRDLNRELFYALRLQKIALFFALGLIVAVSTFNVASTLMVLVRERMRHIGVLGAIGLAPRRLAAIFLLYGGFLGAVGTALGLTAGWAICWVLTTFELIRFSPEVAAIYFIDSVPFRLRPIDAAAIVGFSLALTLAACLLPALRASRTEPAAALRYE